MFGHRHLPAFVLRRSPICAGRRARLALALSPDWLMAFNSAHAAPAQPQQRSAHASQETPASSVTGLSSAAPPSRFASIIIGIAPENTMLRFRRCRSLLRSATTSAAGTSSLSGLLRHAPRRRSRKNVRGRRRALSFIRQKRMLQHGIALRAARADTGLLLDEGDVITPTTRRMLISSRATGR